MFHIQTKINYLTKSAKICVAESIKADGESHLRANVFHGIIK